VERLAPGVVDALTGCRPKPMVDRHKAIDSHDPHPAAGHVLDLGDPNGRLRSVASGGDTIINNTRRNNRICRSTAAIGQKRSVGGPHVGEHSD